MSPLLDDALAIWHAGLAAVRPEALLAPWFAADSELANLLDQAPRILVVGAGKAGASMAQAVEALIPQHLHKVQGLINVPNEDVRPLQRIELHGARPAGSNHPTEAGVHGAQRMLELLASAGPNDVALCLISGGGSALLPAPVDGITLAEKQQITRLLHACGARIDEMNCVRKHLSAVKGGRLALAFRGRALRSLILSDVVGDPLDVIASGPTVSDPSTFADARSVIDRYGLRESAPPAVLRYLASDAPETCKELPSHVQSHIVGNNSLALRAAQASAESRGYRVLNLGAFIEGESAQVATALMGVVRSIQREGAPISAPACLLCGGETTVMLSANHGKGGRNQEFVLASLLKLGESGMRNIAVLSAGTDGEDGPTDAAGAFADAEITARALAHHAADHLHRHDAYPLFDAIGGLLRTGLTQTNVMDIRIVLIR